VPYAEALVAQDPYQFQWWALGLVGARPVELKKGYPRRGIDGHAFRQCTLESPQGNLAFPTCWLESV